MLNPLIQQFFPQFRFHCKKPQGDHPHPPSSIRVAKAGRNNLNEVITPLLPTGIGEGFSQTISNLGHAALLRRCELPLFENLLRSPGIDSQPVGPVRQPYMSYQPARLHRLAESISWNRFLGSRNVYKFGLCTSCKISPRRVGNYSAVSVVSDAKILSE